MTQRASFAFRSGQSSESVLFADENNEPLMIAHQKSIIIAHSYGGLLSRWYLEQAEDPEHPGQRLFDNRRDVMRLITLGTPHKGAPITNIITEALKGGLLGQSKVAELKGYFIFKNFQEVIALFQDPTPIIEALFGRTYTYDPATGKPYPAIEVMTIGSQILEQLNSNAFHDDVSYAAVAGTDNSYDLYKILRPISYRPGTEIEYSWFPWLNQAIPGPDDNDAVVPTWSAALGVPAFNAYVEADHSNLPSAPWTYEFVSQWISGRDANGQPNRVPLGSEHRQAFDPQAPLSVRNALVGSKFSPATNTNTGGGLNRDAFMKIEFDPSDISARYGVFPTTLSEPPYRMGTLPSDVGVRGLVLTGMIQWKDRNSVRLKVAFEGRSNIVLHDLGVLSLADLNIPASATIGVQDDDWVPFRVTKATIGRDNLNNLIGPSGKTKINLQQASLRYLLQTASQSLPQLSRELRLNLPKYSLGAPIYHSATQTLQLIGTARAVDIGSGSQTTFISLRHEVNGQPVTLLDVPVTVDHPPGVWANLLLAYWVDVAVTFDSQNRILLNGVATNLTAIQIYQQVLEPDGWFQPKSIPIRLKK